MTTNPSDLVEIMVSTAKDLRDAIEKLDESGIEKARTEHRYRHAKSVATVKLAGVGKNVPEREARVQLELVDTEGDPVTVESLRYARDLAESSAQGHLERVRSLRTILSSYQTAANAYKAEAEFARTEPSWGSA